MTALRKYQRLESPGIWRATSAAQRREVVVAFRDATLILYDPKSELALTHWSLPAVTRLNPGQEPALYSPLPDGIETLEIEDAEMIAALETVRQVLIHRQPRPGRLRGVLLAGSATIVLALVVFWLPDALIRHTAAVLPAATRASVGRLALADVTRLTGSACDSVLGKQAAAKLSTRLLGKSAGEVVILREGLAQSVILPGNIVLLNRELVETAPDAEVAAGFVLAEVLRAESSDPMIPLLRHAGLIGTIRLLTSGKMPQTAINGYAETLLQTAVEPLDTQRLLAKFQMAEVSPAAYAYAVDATGETTLGLIEADPFKGRSPRPVLDDSDWISLQTICAAP